MSNNIYSSGLRNVGSYQVSGKPFASSSVITGTHEEQITFPEVSNNITVKHNGQVYNSLYLSGSDNGGLYYINEKTPDAPANSAERSLSVWLSGSGQHNAGSGGDNGIVISGTETNNKFVIREKDGKLQGLHSYANGAQSVTTAVQFPTEGWKHFVLTVNDDEMKLYIDRDLNKTSTAGDTTVGANLGSSLVIGSVGNFEGEYGFRDAILWDTALSLAQVQSLFDSSGSATSPAGANKLIWLKPSSLIGENLTSLKNHADVHTYGNFILKNRENAEIANIVPEAPFADVNGGELRVHYRTTGSTNVATNNHYWSLNNQDEQISMNIKTKDIYLSAPDGDAAYSLHADLTTIPTSSMYQHTGLGVDD